MHSPYYHTYKAIETGNKPIIEKWLQEDSRRVNKCRGGSVILRHFAVANGTALHWAVSYGQVEIAQLLLDNGAGRLQDVSTTC